MQNFEPDSLKWYFLDNSLNDPNLLIIYKYYYVILIIMVLLLFVIQFFYMNERHKTMKKQKIPFVHMYNLLNGSTMKFFTTNKLKIKEDYFNFMLLLVSKYDKYLQNSIWKKKINIWSILLYLYHLFMYFFNWYIWWAVTSDYYIIHIIFTLTVQICIIISVFIIYKTNNNKWLISSYKSQKIIQEWWLLNRELPSSNDFHNKFADHYINLCRNKQNLYLKDFTIKNKKIKLYKDISNYDTEIFKSQEEFLNFLIILPFDKLYKNKKSKEPIIWN